jgi:hypothetical protein
MGIQHLQQMDLDVEQVRLATDFFESYANTTLSELNAYDDRPMPPQLPGQEDQRWILRVDAASALREAAQWAMFFDPDRARRLLIASASHFLHEDNAFGIFLMTAVGSWDMEPPLDVFRRSIDGLAQLHGESPPSGESSSIPLPLYHPQQQAYLLLACGGTPIVASEYGPRLRELANRSPNRVGVTPVGALGTPIRHFWDIAIHLLEGDVRAGPSAVLGHVAAMAERYADSIELATVNRYLWEHAAAPVDVGDIDVVGILALAVSRFGWGPVVAAVDEARTDLTPLASTSIEIAMDVADRY